MSLEVVVVPVVVVGSVKVMVIAWVVGFVLVQIAALTHKYIAELVTLYYGWLFLIVFKCSTR